MNDSDTMIRPLGHSDFLTLEALTPGQFEMLFRTAERVKADVDAYAGALRGKSVILLFEKASLRTRVTFEVGIHRLGGQALYFDHSAQRIGQREAIKDYGKNLDRWVHAIVARVYKHSTLTELAEHARIPVVNALCDLHHPCQALADLFTLRERFGSLAGVKLAYVGDGNNVCQSLMIGASKLGMHMTVVTPKGYAPEAAFVNGCLANAKESGATLTVSTDPTAVAGHDAVYTDTWVSMGDEAEAKKREKAFPPYQVNEGLMRLAGKNALFMHCLPAHRGQEVTDEVIDSANSVVLEEAENRLHVQNALLLHLLAPGFVPALGNGTVELKRAAPGGSVRVTDGPLGS